MRLSKSSLEILEFKWSHLNAEFQKSPFCKIIAKIFQKKVTFLKVAVQKAIFKTKSKKFVQNFLLFNLNKFVK